MIRTPRRRPVAAGAALVALMVAAVVGLTVLPSYLSGPERALEDFFDALAEHDMDAALALTASPAGAEASGLAPLDDAYVPPAGLSITSVEDVTGDQGDGEVVRAGLTYLVGDRTLTAQVDLTRPDGLSPFRSWRLSSWSGTITVEAEDPLVPQVDGEPLTETDGTWQIEALPGSYPVTATELPAVTGDPVTADVGFGTQATVDLTRSLRSDVRTAVGEQVGAYLDDCAASTDPEPADCPFAADSSVIVAPDPLTWQVVSYPELKLTVNRAADEIRVTTVEQGEVHAEEPEGVYTDDEPVSVTGTATVADDGTVTFQPELVR